jgi:hypothetical protein
MVTRTIAGIALLAGALLGAAPAAHAYQWKAEPAWLANTGVYRDHELVYQDYLFDDHGANTDGVDRADAPFGTAGPDLQTPTDPRLSPAPAINWAGDFTYPSADGTHIADVADLTEFRVAADDDAVHYRVRLGEMPAADSSVVAICADEDRNRTTGVQTWPNGANLTSALGCERIYTLYGTGADVTDASGTKALAAGSVSADPANGYVEMSVPRAIADPGEKTWRLYVASGMWDAAAHAWAAPAPGPAAAGAPVATGGSPTAPNFFDLLSNNGEPNSTWDEEKQANDLARADIVSDYLDVDFGRLASRFDDPDPRRTGVVERIYETSHPGGRGRDISRGLGIQYVYRGDWQPYVAVIPSDYYARPFARFPFDQCMHPLGANHNVEVFYGEALSRKDYNPVVTGVTPQTGYLGTQVITSLIDRLGAVYACGLGRGEGVGFTGGDGSVDTIEVARDMERRYRTDSERRFVHGVSLGAIGSWHHATSFPDRFAAAMPYIFTGSSAYVRNLYNLPVLFSIGTFDEFGEGRNGDPEADALEAAQDEYVYLHYLGRQHEGRIENDFLPFVEQLGYSQTRVKNPARVKFEFAPGRYPAKEPGNGAAYWLRASKPRSGASSSYVDAVSLARAAQLPTSQVVFDGVYVNTPKQYRARIRGLMRVTEDEFAKVWRPADFEGGWEEVSLTATPTTFPARDVENAFTLNGTGLGSATLDTERMGLDPRAVITGTLDGDGATALTLLGDFGNGTKATLDGAPVDVAFDGDGLTVAIPAGHHVLVLDQARTVGRGRSVSVAPPGVAGDRVSTSHARVGSRIVHGGRVRLTRRGTARVTITGRTRSGRHFSLVRSYRVR